MGEKKNKGLVVGMAALGVGIVLLVVCCIFVQTLNRPEKLKTNREEVQETEETEEIFMSESTQQEISLPDFSVSKVEGMQGEEGNGEYLCEYSSERLITEEDIMNLKMQQVDGLPEDHGMIQMVINEIYAKHGYKFKTESIQQYFEQKSWYQAIAEYTEDYDLIYQSMSDIERTNVDFLKAHSEEGE